MLNSRVNPFQTKGDNLAILDLIGKGGFGEVFRCYDSSLNKFLAIKILFIEKN